MMNKNKLNFNISKASIDDLMDILTLQKRAFISEAKLYNDFNIEPLTQTYDSILNDFDDYIFFKAKFKDKIVGSVKAKNTDDYCWIGRLAVDPKFQNMGLGKRLMLEIEMEFPNAKKFSLCTGYKSIKNISLYQSIGYQVSEIIIDKNMPGIKLVRMIKIK